MMLMMRAHQDMSAAGTAAVFRNAYWTNILTGGLMGTLMFLNVWLIIWPKQKIIIANAKATAGGSAPDPRAAIVAPQAGLASRTNTLFSIPMLFFMLAANHLGFEVKEGSSNTMLYWILVLIIIGGIEINGIKGKMGPITTIKGAVTSGFVLTVIFIIVNMVTI
jgi:uncharacterized membrane protein